MKYQVTINAVTTLTVEADSAIEAEDAALDIFRLSTCDGVNVEVIEDREG